METIKRKSLPVNSNEDKSLSGDFDNRLLWVRKKIEEGYYNSEEVKGVIAEKMTKAFMEIFSSK